MVLPPFLGLFPHVLLKINMAMNSEALGILPSSSPRWELGGFPAGGGCWVTGLAAPTLWHPDGRVKLKGNLLQVD